MKRILVVLVTMVVFIASLAVRTSETSAASTSFVKGIDVSSYQGTIDWTSVGKSGINFAIIRCATTNIVNANYSADKYFTKNYTGAVSAGLNVGAYMYTSAASKAEMKSNITSMLSTIGGRKFDLPIFLDVEQASRQTALGKAALTDILIYGCGLIKAAGYQAGVYANYNWLTNYVNPDKIRSAGYEIWMARYPSGSYAVNPADYDFSNIGTTWQYSSLGKVSGISGNVDVDVRYTNKNTVTIHYNTNGGSIAGDSDYYAASNGDVYQTSTKKILAPVWANGYTTPYGLYNASTFKLTRTGYKFLGWSLSKSGGKIFDQDDGSVSANDLYPDVKTKSGTVTLYAQWEINTLNMKYNTNGGVIAQDSPYYEKNGAVYKVSDSSELVASWKYNQTVSAGLYNCTTFDMYREHYKFIGWSTTASGGKIYDENAAMTAADIFSDITSKSGTVTMYAQWEAVPTGLWFYTNESQKNYMLGSDLKNAEKLFFADNAKNSTVSFDHETKYKNEPTLQLSVLQADDKKSYKHLTTKTSLPGSASYGYYPETKTYYLSFYAKAYQDNSSVSVRLGYDDVYSTVKLDTSWKWYCIELHKVPAVDNWVHWFFDKTGAYQLSHLMVTDAPCTEADFVAEPETNFMSHINYTNGEPYGELPVPEREGYRFAGWFKERDGGEEITADTIAGSNHYLYAKWLKTGASVSGDVNADGEFNAADVVMLQKWLIGAGDLTNWQNADLYEDGIIDAFDLVVMKRKLIYG